jgi:hypothetical protein
MNSIRPLPSQIIRTPAKLATLGDFCDLTSCRQLLGTQRQKQDATHAGLLGWLHHLQAHDLGDLELVQGLEHDELVDAVDELRPELLPHLHDVAGHMAQLLDKPLTTLAGRDPGEVA